MEIQKQVPLASLTTFKIGGPASHLAIVSTIDEIKKSLDFARDHNQRVLILGGGSNVLIDDSGWDGLVIKVAIKGIEKEGNVLVVGAGEEWDALVVRSVDEQLWGIENLSGIPGTVGGAVNGNIGAYGQALSQTLLWVEALDTETGAMHRIINKQCAFGYRDSCFKHATTQQVIVRAAFKLSEDPKPELSYKDLKEYFTDKEVSQHSIRETVLSIRENKFPDLSLEGTAGSFFKNPIVSKAEAEVLCTTFPEMPIFAMPETSGVKIPLAWILDHILSMRGEKVGRARLYEKQPLVIVAERNCTAQEVRDLAKVVQQKVFDTTHIAIEPEVLILTKNKLSTDQQ